MGAAMSSGVGCRCSSDPKLLWLWYRLAAVAPTQPLAWELPYALGTLKNKKQKTKKKKREREFCGDLQVKVLALSLLLWLRFDPWPQNFCMLQVIVMKKNFLKRSSHCGLTGSTAS